MFALACLGGVYTLARALVRPAAEPHP